MDQTTANPTWKLILAGNPNVGKSVVFHALTGAYAEVSNYPGTTVDLLEGRFESYRLIDTPGVYGLSTFNEEERITLEAVQDSDLLLNVVDGTHLARDLFLTLQLLAQDKPLVIAVNMMDEVEAQGLHIDWAKLEQALGLPLIPLCATTGAGLGELKKALKKGGYRGRSAPENFGPAGAPETLRRQRHFLDQLIQEAVTAAPTALSLGQRLGQVLLHPLLALPLLTGLLLLIFLFIGVFLAQFVVEYTEGLLLGVYYHRFITTLVLRLLPESGIFTEILIGEYGVLTMVPIYLLGLILPLVAGFYFVMACLEDSGVLPRIAVLCDRLFSSFGLNGKAVIPLLLGFGCVTMSLISTRILGTKRERTIAACLLCIAVPCSAQFSIILAVAFQLPGLYLALYLLLMLFVFTLVAVLLNLILPGTSSDLFLTLPPLRLPRPVNLLRKTFLKARHFLQEAGPLFLGGGLLLSLLSVSGGFALLYQLLSPLTTGLLGLPEESATLFITSMIKRDLGAVQLYALIEAGTLSVPQTLVALTVITLLVPCFASVAILCKEQGKLQAALIWLGSLAIALAAGSFMAFLVY